MTDDRIREIIMEEISKADVNSIVSNKIDSIYDSREFKKRVKNLVSDVINELFKTLWQKNNMWKSSVIN